MTTQVKLTLTHSTGLPEDVVTNTFHFADVGAPKLSSLDADNVAADIEEFFNTNAPLHAFDIASYIGPAISRNANACRLDFYDLEDPSPRVPYEQRFFTMNPAGSANGLPGEVALVVSWTADPVSGVPAGRLRGRSYIGSLIDNAAVTTLGITRPATQLISALVESAYRLVSTGSFAPRVYSRTSIPDLASVITKVHVDNAFDTMRSRGVAPTSRVEAP